MTRDIMINSAFVDDVGFEDLTAVSTNRMVFWDFMSRIW
jgi:hypothetical protein